MSSLQREIMKRQGGGGLPPRPFQSVARSLPKRGQKDYSPLPWTSYFDAVKNVNINGEDVFRVYTSGFEREEEDEYANKPLLVLLHGGGYSGLTWSLFVKSLLQLCYCKVAAIDLRGHGSTVTQNDDDLASATLAVDVGKVCQNLLHDEEDEPPLVLVGHSMGGAIAIHCANSCHELIPTLTGLIVIDVVEGTAIDALQGMQSLLRSRPAEFRSIENAIEWR